MSDSRYTSWAMSIYSSHLKTRDRHCEERSFAAIQGTAFSSVVHSLDCHANARNDGVTEITINAPAASKQSPPLQKAIRVSLQPK